MKREIVLWIIGLAFATTIFEAGILLKQCPVERTVLRAPNYDLNQDGKIDMQDMSILASQVN